MDHSAPQLQEKGCAAPVGRSAEDLQVIRTSAINNVKHVIALRRELVHRVGFCLIILLGATLRFYDLGAESYWLDEVTMVHVAGARLESISAEVLENGRPPVFVLLAHFWIQLFGTSEAATRALSASLSVISLPLIYIVGTELFGRSVGLLSTFLMASSEFQIFHAQDFRYYSLLVPLTLLSFLFYIRGLKRNSRGYLILYILASVLLFYTHYFVVFLFLAQWLYFLLQWHKYRTGRVSWLVCQALILLAIGPRMLPPVMSVLLALRPPAVPTSAASSTNTEVQFPGPDWIPDRPLWYPVRTLLIYVLPSATGLDYTLLFLEVVIFVVGIALFRLYQGQEQLLQRVRALARDVKNLSTKASSLLFVGGWLLCPVIVPFVLSKIFKPIYLDRYTIGAAPACYLMLALAIMTVRKLVPTGLALGLVVLLISPGLRQYYVLDVKEQWREIAAYIEQHGGQGDVVVFTADDDRQRHDAFYWYYRGTLPGCSLDGRLKDDQAIADALTACTSAYSRFWLIVQGPIRTAPVARFADFFLNREHQDIQLLESDLAFGRPRVYLFARTRP